MSIPLPGRILPLVPDTFRALRYRDFRLLWIGQVVSLSGTWMQWAAQGWLVLRLTDSAFYLGLIGFCTYVPVLLFALAAGVAADHLPRRNALLWTQGVAMLLAAVLAALTWFGWVRLWQIALLAFGQGTAAAFDIPLRQSLLQDLVVRKDLQNAIALNSLAFNGARLVGPVLAGFLVAAYGEALCFLVNAVSFLAVLVGLALMRVPGTRAGNDEASWIGAARAGLSYAVQTPRVRAVLGLVVVSSVFGMPYSILLPVFARDVLLAGSRGLGMLMGAAGLGAVAGALYLAARRTSRYAGRIVATAVALLGAAVIGFGVSRSFVLSLILLIFVGAALLIQLATSNTLLQLTAPPELRGRIVSLYMLAFIGMAPIGSLLSGIAARTWGAPATVIAGGVVCVLAAILFATRIPTLRRAG